MGTWKTHGNLTWKFNETDDATHCGFKGMESWRCLISKNRHATKKTCTFQFAQAKTVILPAAMVMLFSVL